MSFSKGGKSSSTTYNETNNTSRNLNIQDVEGITVGEAGGDVTVFNTDMNAFDRASDLAQRSLDVAQSIGMDAQNLSLKTGALLSDSYSDSLSQVNQFGARAFDTVENALQQSGDLSQSFFDKVVGFVGDFSKRSQDTLTGTVTTLNAIARESSKSTDERVAEISGNAMKYTLLAVVGLGALFLFMRQKA